MGRPRTVPLELTLPQTTEEINQTLVEVEAAIERREKNKTLADEALELMLDLGKFIRGAWHVVQPLDVYLHNWHIDAIVEHLHAISTNQIRRLQVWVPPGSMKPVDEDALVLMGDGARKRLAEVVIGDFVISHTGRPCRVSEVHEQGTLETLLITTDSGRTVHTAPDHPFLTPSGWKQADELIVGEALGTITNPQTDAVNGKSLEEFRLIGYFVGDGNTCHGKKPGNMASNITCVDPVQAEDIVHCAESMGFVARHSAAARRYDLSGGVRPWLRETELAGKSSWTKRVPEFVFASPREHIAHFVGAYFACDGTLGHWREERSTASVIFNSVNRDLLEDVQHLLLRFGVKSRIRLHVSRRNNFTGGEHRSWRLPITSTDDTSKFIDSIPVIGAKAERLQKIGVLRTRFDEQIQPDRIKSIEPGGLKQCRCLTVEEDGSFTANDLIVKNSRAVSVFWPAWEWTHSPSLRYWTGSYDIRLSKELATHARDLILSDWYQDRWGHEFQMKKLNEAWYTNDQGGSRLSTSPDSSGLGVHGNRIIVDDPVDGQAADSTTRSTLNKANEWYSGKLATRGLANYAEVIIMQRLHEQDLAAYALTFGDDWHVLCLPEQYEKKHPYAWSKDPRDPDNPKLEGVEQGEGVLLWPARRDAKEHHLLVQKLGKTKAAGQLQQRPAAREGTIIPRSDWRYFPVAFVDAAENGDVSKLPKFRRIVCAWDTSFKDDSSADFVAGGVWGILGGHRYLLRIFHERASLSRTKTAMLEQRAWAMRRWPRLPVHVLIEKASNGIEIIEQLKREVPGIIPLGTGIKEGGRSVNKTARAEACEPDFNSHSVHVPGEANEANSDYSPSSTPAWVQDVIEECSSFPTASNDDLVDMVTMALNWVRAKGGGSARISSPARTQIRVNPLERRSEPIRTR